MAAKLKVPPHDIDVEQAVLGSMLINSRCIPAVKKEYREGLFYGQAHSRLCEAILDVGADPLTLKQELQKRGQLESIGGFNYIATLFEVTATSAAAEHHLSMLKKLFKRREIMRLASTISDRAMGGVEEPEQILSDLKRDLRNIENDSEPDSATNLFLTQEIVKDIEQRKKNEDRSIGPLTGFKDIDTHINGLEPATTTYVIARPSIGKTALMLNIADHIAFSYPGMVIIFSLEMAKLKLARRRLSCHSGVYLSRLRSGDVDESQWPDILEAADRISELSPIIIDHPKYRKVENLIAKIEMLATQHPISAVFIDHIQKTKSGHRFQNRHLELSYASESFCDLARHNG